jgi:hypothetical protein
MRNRQKTVPRQGRRKTVLQSVAPPDRRGEFGDDGGDVRIEVCEGPGERGW